ncbi:hypothetical protein INR49_008561 [Caranx melampygus]|nr:hypothetical protein INR49_008561 [Caranx melampygus]
MSKRTSHHASLWGLALEGSGMSCKQPIKCQRNQADSSPASRGHVPRLGLTALTCQTVISLHHPAPPTTSPSPTLCPALLHLPQMWVSDLYDDAVQVNCPVTSIHPLCSWPHPC